MHAPAVKKLKLLDGRETKASVAGGVGGLKKVRHGTLKTATIGGCEVSDIPATFSEAEGGLAASDEALATAGLKLLQRFRVIVNESAGRIGFVQTNKKP